MEKEIKVKKIIGYIITVISVVFMIYFLYSQYFTGYDSGEEIVDTRMQLTDKELGAFSSVVLVSEKTNVENYGTGYVVGKNTVVTNKHVIVAHKNGPEKLLLRVGHKDKNGNVEFKEFEVENIVIPENEAIDAAVLTVKKDKEGKSIGDIVKIAEFGDISKLKVGDFINVVGYPGDKEYATLWLSGGPLRMIEGNFISFAAVTKPGNSGSPIYNEEGKVIAMNNAGDTNASFGFLIDDEIKTFIKNNTK